MEDFEYHQWRLHLSYSTGIMNFSEPCGFVHALHVLIYLKETLSLFLESLFGHSEEARLIEEKHDHLFL